MTTACEPVLNSRMICTFLFALAPTSITPIVQLENKIKLKVIFDIWKYTNESSLFFWFIKFASNYVLKLWTEIFYIDFWALGQCFSKSLILELKQYLCTRKITVQDWYDKRIMNMMSLHIYQVFTYSRGKNFQSS